MTVGLPNRHPVNHCGNPVAHLGAGNVRADALALHYSPSLHLARSETDGEPVERGSASANTSSADVRPAKKPATGKQPTGAKQRKTVAAAVLLATAISESVVLVPVDMRGGTPRCLMPVLEGAAFGNDLRAPGDKPNVRRANTRPAAEALLDDLLPPRGGKPVARCHMAGLLRLDNGTAVYVIAAPIHGLLTPPEAAGNMRDAQHVAAWQRPADIRNKGAFAVATAAVAGVRMLATPWACMPANVTTGAVPDAPVETSARAAAKPMDVLAVHQLALREMKRFDALLQSVALADDYLADTAQCWRGVVADSQMPPPGVMECALMTNLPGMAYVAFPRPAPLHATDAVPISMPQPPLPAGIQVPRHPDDCYKTWAKDQQVQQRRAIARYHNKGGKQPQTRVWDDDALLEPFQGKILDYRGGIGKGVLLDTIKTATDSHLHAPAYNYYFSKSKNRRLTSTVNFGMVLRDERPRLTMYAANNASFKTTLGGVAAVIGKAWEFVDLKWMFHGAGDGSPVIVPPNVLPRGSTDRTGLAGQDPRALIDASHPHDNQTVCVELEPGYHGPRQIVKSLNVALGPMRHTPNETNPKNWTESKPLGCDAALAGAVLWDAAHRLHTINITFCFDFAKFFHQVCMRAGEMCKICALLPERLTAAGATPRLVQLADAVLGMGISCASNIMQELGDELQVELMTQVAIAATPLIDSWRQSNASFDAWCTIREAMPHDQSGSQLRLLMALIFTDDAFWQAVSPEIAALTVSCFHHMIGPAHVTRDEIGVAAEVAALLGARYVAATVPRPAGINLWAAKPYKWGGGISTKWCGAIYSGVFAVVWLPPDKALRTLEGIQLFVQQRMQLLEFRSFHGFLVSVRFALGNDRYLLEGLSVLLKGAGTPDWDGTRDRRLH